MLGVAPRPHFHEDHRAVIERDEIEIAPENPFPTSDDAIAQPLKILRRQVLTASAEVVAGVCSRRATKPPPTSASHD